MKIKPILTEKGLELAKSGKYCFWVPSGLTRHKIAKLIEESFGVDVTSTRTMNYRARVKTNMQRRKIRIKAAKKAIVTLKEKQKIDVFLSAKE